MSIEIDYKLVCANNVADFEIEVTKLLNEGYTLHGVRTVDINDTGKVFYTQAMVKEGNEDNETMLTENEENEYCDTMSIEDSDF